MIFWRLEGFPTFLSGTEVYCSFIEKIGPDITKQENNTVLMALEWLVQLSLKYKVAAFALEYEFNFYNDFINYKKINNEEIQSRNKFI